MRDARLRKRGGTALWLATVHAFGLARDGGALRLTWEVSSAAIVATTLR
jgi:hypothetical protein